MAGTLLGMNFKSAARSGAMVVLATMLLHIMFIAWICFGSGLGLYGALFIKYVARWDAYLVWFASALYIGIVFAATSGKRKSLAKHWLSKLVVLAAILVTIAWLILAFKQIYRFSRWYNNPGEFLLGTDKAKFESVINKPRTAMLKSALKAVIDAVVWKVLQEATTGALSFVIFLLRWQIVDILLFGILPFLLNCYVIGASVAFAAAVAAGGDGTEHLDPADIKQYYLMPRKQRRDFKAHRFAGDDSDSSDDEPYVNVNGYGQNGNYGAAGGQVYYAAGDQQDYYRGQTQYPNIQNAQPTRTF